MERGGSSGGGGRGDRGGGDRHAGELARLAGFEDAEGDAEDEEEDAEVNGAFLEDVSGLGAPDLVGDAGAKSGAEAFLFGALHEDEEDDQQADNNQQRADEVDGKGQHGKSTMDEVGEMTNGNSGDCAGG